MWLCTQHGFYSIVQKTPNEYHLRARTRKDLENLLQAMNWVSNRAGGWIEEWPDADYRWRIIIRLSDLQEVMVRLATRLDYPNFKGRIHTLPDQRRKMGAYHALHHAGTEWQEEDLDQAMDTAVGRLINTSVDDLKSGLPHISDLTVLRAALDTAEARGMKSKATLLDRRIRQLTK